MMRVFLATACACLIAGGAVRAQFITPPLPVTLSPGCVQPEPHTLWSFLGLSHQNLKKCRYCFCGSRVGRMCDSVVTPFRLASGGLVPKLCCDVPTRDELACMSLENCSLAELVAAKIKRDEAEACGRRAAVRFLGTVDCHYYHEAEEALIAHLRADQNECVRLEAASVLAKGCCCTPRTIAALKVAVSGTAEDGNPPERSERVKGAALHALQSCISCYADMMSPDGPLEMPPIEVLPPPGQKLNLPIQLMAYYESASEKKPAANVGLEAQRTFAAKVGAPVEERQTPRPSRHLLQIVAQASTPTSDATPAMAETLPRRESLLPSDLTPIGVVPAIR